MNSQAPTAKSSPSGVSQATGATPGRPVALTIAGFDPSSGAGITADLKTFSAHDVYGVACISTITVQSTTTVRSIEPLPAKLVRQTLDCLVEDLSLSGVKIGMLGNAQIAGEVADFLKAESGTIDRRSVVLDPVLRSSSGSPLIDQGGVRRLREDLLSCVGWITPNLFELAALTGIEPAGRAEIPEGARRLREMGIRSGNRDLNVVVTGGHLDRPDDFLLTASGQELWLTGERIATNATHGTGCAFSSSLLCHLVAGCPPVDAVANAKAYVAAALRLAYRIGKGKGPMNHLFRLS